MLAGSGRPRKACDPCKRFKVRCSGERPVCRRCSRLRHNCIYAIGEPVAANSSLTRSNIVIDPVSTPGRPSRTQVSACDEYNTPESAAQSSVSVLHPSVPERALLGIPDALVTALVDVYFSHVYNAPLLVHRPSFVRELEAGTADPTVVLSICAFASIFYRDSKGSLSLREHGFGVDWAERAGKMAFSKVEKPSQNNLVAFLNLLLFWYSQGSWQRSHVHKANAFQVAHTLGLGHERRGKEKLFESEVRRRHFWACYLVDCHAAGACLSFFASTGPGNLSLPWLEEDFEACRLSRTLIPFTSTETNGGIYCEMVKAMTLWSSVYDSIKLLELSVVNRVTTIHSLDAQITDWWASVPAHLKLSSCPAGSPHTEASPKLLLIEAAYHQSLCALHASIVPLFSWSPDDKSWGLARQLSAQVAFEHACAASTLFESFLAKSQDLAAAPSFVAYAAYCSCAIQIPFLWSFNLTLKERVRSNIKINIQVIQALGIYWKFSALLGIHVQYLYRMHAKNPITLEGEPKDLDPSRLRGFRVTASHARESILGHNEILWARGEGCAEPGQEVFDLGADDDKTVPSAGPTAIGPVETSVRDTTDFATSGLWSQLHTPPNEYQQQQAPPTTLDTDSLGAAVLDTDFFYPFLDPERSNLFSGGEEEVLDFGHMNGISLDQQGDFWNWLDA